MLIHVPHLYLSNARDSDVLRDPAKWSARGKRRRQQTQFGSLVAASSTSLAQIASWAVITGHHCKRAGRANDQPIRSGFWKLALYPHSDSEAE